MLTFKPKSLGLLLRAGYVWLNVDKTKSNALFYYMLLEKAQQNR